MPIRRTATTVPGGRAWWRGPGWVGAWSWAAVGLAVVWNAWHWRPELTGVPYLDDSSVHDQMVRFATRRLQAGHLPLTSWFPYLGLGSPHFLHYQSLPSMLTGAAGMVVGGDVAFRWSLYLLLVLWPLPVFVSARVFGLSRGAAAVTAAASPFLASAIGVGYEPKAYVWIGYGVWAQLWASWTLPLAWAFTWRAMSSRRAVLPAVVFVALTMALHFETGYLAAVAIVIVPFLSWPGLRDRLRRAGLVALGSLLCSAWVTVPLIADGRWAATNEILAPTPLVNGYGAKTVLSWLVTGRLYDAGRFPIVTVLVAVGLGTCLVRWRTDSKGRAIVALWVVSLLLSFGRTTFGVLTKVLPGSTDIFMRRFMMGIQLAGLFLAGIGAITVLRLAARVVDRVRPPLAAWARTRRAAPVVAGVALVALVGALAPAWTQMGAYAGRNAEAVAAQRATDTVSQPQIGAIIAYVRQHGGGRAYAGLPSNWGTNFTVGVVPVFKYLESQDIDEVGYTLRTASLMTDPEYFFDEDVPGDFALFGIRYLILPAGHVPPVPADLVLSRGPYDLWVIPDDRYVRVVDTVGVLTVDRTDVGVKSVAYLRSPLPGMGEYLAVGFDGDAPSPLTAPTAAAAARTDVGTVRSETDHLADGTVRATVMARHKAVVVLSASFDPGWTVVVDGHRARPEMLAPALVGVTVDAGVHTVVFDYVGFSAYPALFAVLVVAFVALVWISIFGAAPEPISAPPDGGEPAWRGTWRGRLRPGGRRGGRRDRSSSPSRH